MSISPLHINLFIQGFMTLMNLIDYVTSRNIDLSDKDREQLEAMVRRMNEQINQWRKT